MCQMLYVCKSPRSISQFPGFLTSSKMSIPYLALDSLFKGLLLVCVLAYTHEQI